MRELLRRRGKEEGKRRKKERGQANEEQNGNGPRAYVGEKGAQPSWAPFFL